MIYLNIIVTVGLGMIAAVNVIDIAYTHYIYKKLEQMLASLRILNSRIYGKVENNGTIGYSLHWELRNVYSEVISIMNYMRKKKGDWK